MLTVYKNNFIAFAKKIISFIRYILICVSQNLRANFSNKKSFFIQSALMAINNITWLIVWLILFSKNNGSINGLNMNDILYVWSLPVIAFGLTYFCFGGAEYLATNIVSGNLDVYLTQPKFSLIGLITSRCKVSALGDFVYGLILGIFAVNFNIIQYIFLILLAIVAAIALTSIVVIINCLAFWLGEVTNLTTTYMNSLYLTLTIYPKEMYNSFTKILIYTVVPTFYTTYLPISICKDFNIVTLLLFILSTTLFTLCAVGIYTKGLKRYTSGNAFNLKY